MCLLPKIDISVIRDEGSLNEPNIGTSEKFILLTVNFNVKVSTVECADVLLGDVLSRRRFERRRFVCVSLTVGKI
jgi:hypothetical protein